MKPKIILITGAWRGLGLATARQLAGRGHIVFASARDAGKIPAEAGIHPLTLDVTSDQSVRAAVSEIQTRHDRLDVLINNAAVLLDDGDSALKVAPEVLARTFETNTTAPLRLIQAFLPLLRKSEAPRIVNVSSRAGQLSDGEPATWAPAYSASKAALNALTQQFASALPGFAVNSVCPGWCRTEMGGPDAPLTPEQGADGIAWLADGAPQNLTGGFFRDRQPIVW